MKIYKLSFLLFIFIFLSCQKKDEGHTDVDGQKPTLKLTQEHIHTEAGRTFTIEGIVEDNDGIASIRLQNTELNLDKTIDLLTLYKELQFKYELEYKYELERDFDKDNLRIKVIVTDVGNRVTEGEVLVTMDGDFTAPTFTTLPDENITVLIKNNTKLNLQFTVEDDKALDYVTVSIEEIDYTKKVEADGKTFSFKDAIPLPAQAGNYSLTLEVVDKFNLKTTKTSVVTVSQMPDFEKMYLIDVKNASELNSDIFGVPMLIERVGAYTYKAKYYSENAGTEIRFAPQKTDFNPICFGLDPDNKATLTDEPERALPFVLPDGNQYYEIEFNIQSGNYTLTPYTPSDAPVNIGEPMLLDASRPGEGSIPLEIGLVGSGLPNSGNWNPSQPYMLKQDTTNPYILYAEIDLEAGKTVEFIIHNKHSWGWWDYKFWRWDNSGAEPEKNISQGGENPGKWTIKTSGKYMFKFDTHLLRSKFYPIK